MPARWVPPTKILDDFADLGLPIEDMVDFNDVYFSVLGLVVCFLSLLFVVGPWHDYVLMNPDSSLGKYSK